MPATVYLGLGSNQGDRHDLLSRAIEKLKDLGYIKAKSSFIETEPLGFVSSSCFINAVICLETDLSPYELLDKTQTIEKSLGRKTKSKDGIYSDRPLDIDILFYDTLILDDVELTIPHKELDKRLFVLEPLMEIAPLFPHPILGKTIQELVESLG